VFMALGDSHKCGSGCSLAGVGVLAVFNTLLLAALSVVFIFLPMPTTPWLVFWEHSDNSQQGEEMVASIKELNNSSNRVPQDFEDDGDDDVENSSIISSSNSQQERNIISDSQQQIDHKRIIVTSIQDLPSFRLVTVALMMVACAVSVMSVNRCSFLLIGPRQGSIYVSTRVFSDKGLFSQAIDDISGEFIGCVAFSSQTASEFDGAFRTGRAFGAITTMLLTTVLVLATAQLFCHAALRRKIWYSFRLFLPIITVSQLITFSAFASNVCQGTAECRPGGAGIAAILNVFLLLTLSFLVCMLPPPLNPVFKVMQSPPPSSVEEQPQHQVEEEEEDHHHQHPMTEISTDPRIMHHEGPLAGSYGLTDEDTDSDGLYYNWETKAKTGEDDVESIDVKVLYTETEKKTIRTILHKDGSKTITTVIEELLSESDVDAYSDVDPLSVS